MVPAANTCSPAGSTHGLREANKQQCHCGRAPGLPRLFTLTVLEPEQAQSPVQKPSFRSPDFGGREDQLRALEQAGSSAARPSLNTDYDVSSSRGEKPKQPTTFYKLIMERDREMRTNRKTAFFPFEVLPTSLAPCQHKLGHSRAAKLVKLFKAARVTLFTAND